MRHSCILQKGLSVRILIVEDDERIVSFMKRGLEAEDFRIDVASGTSHAFNLITEHIYDLLIIDIFLGPNDGLNFCRTLRERHIDVPILIMTAKGSPETEQASKDAGANAYLAKPFAFEDLIATIARLHPRKDPHDSVVEICVRPVCAQNKPSGVYKTSTGPSKEHD